MICEECETEFEGRADARFCSGACRTRFHRKQGVSVESYEPTVVVEPERLDPKLPGIEDVESYVTRELAVTKAQGLKDHDGLRMARAEAYLRWRHREFVAGRVGSL